MPKVGMEKIRKQQLIDATLASIEEHGLQGTTIASIAKLAGVSTGIISHYFGGKTGLLKGTTLYLLEQLKLDLLAQMTDKKPTAYQRIHYIINANFTSTQSSNKAAVAWLSFWVQSLHCNEFKKLQKINHSRLASNLKFALRQLVKPEHLDMATQILAAQIDGQWLRCALAHSSDEKFKQAGIYCQQVADDLIERYKI